MSYEIGIRFFFKLVINKNFCLDKRFRNIKILDKKYEIKKKILVILLNVL